MENELKNVFISHIHEDDSKLSDLKDLMQKHGIEARDYSVNADKPNRAKSEEYIKSQILGPKIRQCSVLVVYISEETINSKYVNWEIEHATKLDKRIVGVWGNGEKGCEIPEALEEYRDALVGWHGGNIVDAIQGDNTIQENADGTACDARNIDRHPC
jgi:hypothetical protein